MNNLKFSQHLEKPKRHGFSLIEVLIVLALVAMMASLVVINTSSMFENDLGNTAEDIFFGMANEARTQALQSKETRILVWNDENRNLSLQNESGDIIKQTPLPSDFTGKISIKVFLYEKGESAELNNTDSVEHLVFHPSSTTQRYIIEFEYSNYIEQMRIDPFSNLRFVE